MKRLIIFIISSLIGLGLFLWVVSKVDLNEIRDILSTFSNKGLVAVLGLTFLIWFFELWRWKFILKSQGHNLPFLSLGQILFASFSITYLFTPTAVLGGDSFKVYAIKKKFALAWENNISAVIIEKLLSASLLIIFLIIGLFSFLFLTSLPLRNFRIIAIILLIFLASLLGIFSLIILKKKSFLKWFFDRFKLKNKEMPSSIEDEIFRFFDFNKILMWRGLGITFLKYASVLIRCWLIILFLGKDINILVVLTILFFIYLSYLLPFPAGLGGLEASQFFVFGALGLGISTGITFSFILRGADLLIALFGLILLVKLGIEFFVKNIREAKRAFK